MHELARDTAMNMSNAHMLGFEPEQFDAFVRRSVPGVEGEMLLERIGGGQSNPTFFVSYANRRLVLRKKPVGEVLPGVDLFSVSKVTVGNRALA